MAIYIITDKLLQTCKMSIIAFSQTQALKAMERLYNLHPERMAVLCHIPLID